MLIITCLMSNFGFTLFLAIGWAFSEWLGQNKNIKANNVYQFTRNFLKVMIEKGDKK